MCFVPGLEWKQMNITPKGIFAVTLSGSSPLPTPTALPFPGSPCRSCCLLLFDPPDKATTIWGGGKHEGSSRNTWVIGTTDSRCSSSSCHTTSFTLAVDNARTTLHRHFPVTCIKCPWNRKERIKPHLRWTRALGGGSGGGADTLPYTRGTDLIVFSITLVRRCAFSSSIPHCAIHPRYENTGEILTKTTGETESNIEEH